jgi:hypothetical protein
LLRVLPDSRPVVRSIASQRTGDIKKYAREAPMGRARPRFWYVAGALLLASSLLGPATVHAQESSTTVVPSALETKLEADLDGRPLELVKVGNYFCQDFDYPRIHCYSKSSALETAVAPALAASGVTYVVGFDYTFWGGPYMYFSQNYTVLAYIGWNDRVSSFLAQNNLSGRFWTDWFYGGTYYGFCCNSQVPALGSYDNTFSSVYQN